MTSSSTPRSARGGFTLLEVMCAMAILFFVTAQITELCHGAHMRGMTARDLRDLREAADTVFRRLAYEDGRHTDGMRASLEDFYAGWAELPSVERDRWRPFVMEFHRRPRTAAGEAGATGAEPIGGSSSSQRGSSGRPVTDHTPAGTNNPGGGGASDSSDDETTGVELMQLTLTIWHEDEPSEHLIVLQTFITPQDTGTTGSGSGPR